MTRADLSVKGILLLLVFAAGCAHLEKRASFNPKDKSEIACKNDCTQLYETCSPIKNKCDKHDGFCQLSYIDEENKCRKDESRCLAICHK